jgi:hypothetical protein
MSDIYSSSVLPLRQQSVQPWDCISLRQQAAQSWCAVMPAADALHPPTISGEEATREPGPTEACQ